MQRAADRPRVERARLRQCGVGVDAHEGAHLGLARRDAFEAGAQQLDGRDLAPRQPRDGVVCVEAIQLHQIVHSTLPILRTASVITFASLAQYDWNSAWSR